MSFLALGQEQIWVVTGQAVLCPGLVTQGRSARVRMRKEADVPVCGYELKLKFCFGRTLVRMDTGLGATSLGKVGVQGIEHEDEWESLVMALIAVGSNRAQYAFEALFYSVLTVSRIYVYIHTYCVETESIYIQHTAEKTDVSSCFR